MAERSANHDTPDHEALGQLYPHLGKAGDTGDLLDSVRRKSEDSAETQTRFLRENAEKLLQTATAMAQCFQRGGRLLCMGNGGSACDAAHLAVEFNHPVTTGRPALPAINLTADVPMVTAVGNDVGFDEIFQRQVIAQGRAGDMLFGISTSGNSRNLELALQAAHKQGLVTIALLGGDGGRIARSKQAEHCLVVQSDSIHRIQESHLVSYHILWDLVHTLMAAQR